MTADIDVEAEITDLRRTTALVSAALAKVSGVGTSSNGEITVEVDANGHLRDLRLSRTAHRLGDQLPALILDAARKAETDAATQAARIMRPITENPRVQAARSIANELFSDDDAQSQPPSTDDDYPRTFSFMRTP